MKARIRIEEKRLVMLYGLTGDKREKTVKTAKQRGLPVREILPEQLGETLGYLAGYMGFEPSKGQGPAALPGGECMVLAGLEERELHSFLDDLRLSGVDIPLKAVVTGPNQSWTFAQLMEELGREREAIRQAQGKARTSGVPER